MKINAFYLKIYHQNLINPFTSLNSNLENYDKELKDKEEIKINRRKLDLIEYLRKKNEEEVLSKIDIVLLRSLNKELRKEVELKAGI